MEVLEDEEPVLTEVSDGKDFLFIFIVDRSGSMHGKRMETAKDALKLFLRSLPLNSKFSIINFGTKHDFLSVNNSTLIDYDNNNIKEAIAQISTFEARYGGTNILDPLKSAQAI